VFWSFRTFALYCQNYHTSTLRTPLNCLPLSVVPGFLISGHTTYAGPAEWHRLIQKPEDRGCKQYGKPFRNYNRKAAR